MANATLDDLRAFAARALAAEGLAEDRAAAVADVLVRTDALGHGTHGLALLPRYLEEIASGAMARDGDLRVVSDRGAVACYEAGRLPGCWVMGRAMEVAMGRAQSFGTASVAIGNSHHFGGLVTHLLAVAQRRLAAVVFTSAPGLATVAPFGGTAPVLSPAPVGAVMPTGGDPVIVDISASISTNNMAFALLRQGRTYDTDCLIGPDGAPSRDPAVLREGGAHLPAGGMDHGHKGYGWGLMSEMISQGLSGTGRADGVKGMVNTALIQVWDPEAFAGSAAFTAQTDRIVEMCRTAPAMDATRSVRLPGGQALARLAEAQANGLVLTDDVRAALDAVAERTGLALPELVP
ncbi:MAG: Ldh family oxidoreductase [Pseudomonadota bacterium]|nr:Ldh family oxidoreductase [Pseudomonadota bacterium]